MSYFMDQKKKYQAGKGGEYNLQDDSDERVFDKESIGKGEALSDEAFAAQKRLNDKWAGK